MRPGLRWLLMITVLMSALALWWHDEPLHVANAIDQATSNLPLGREAGPAPTTPPASRPLLAAILPRPSLSLDGFDPFVGVVSPAAPTPALPPTVVRPAPVPVSPGPTAPALPYRYLGRMTDPGGEQSVYLAKGDTAVVVQVGTRLEEGYVVQAVSAESIRLHFAPLDAHAVIPIPAQEPAPQ